MTGPVGVGLVGFGMAGASLHAPLIGAEPGLALRAVVSRDPGKVPGPVRVVPTVDALLADPAVELVVVAAPTGAHHAVAAAALRAGRHVVVDKPMTATTAEADELVTLGGDRLAVFHQRRWDSDYLTLTRCLRDGLVGRPATYLARYDRFRPDPVDRWRERPGPGSGLLADLGSHQVDQVLHLFGPPDAVTADVGAQRPGATVDDYYHLILSYGPMRAVLHAGSLVRAPGPRLELHGDAGSYVSGDPDGQIDALLAGRRPGPGPGVGPDPGAGAGWGTDGDPGTVTTAAGTRPAERVPGAYGTFYREMAAAVRGGGPVPVPGAAGREVVRVLELARRAAAEGRTVRL